MTTIATDQGTAKADLAATIAGSRPAALEIFSYDDRIVRDFIIATLVWGAIGMLVGVLIALQLAWPAANFEVSWLTYGRLRPLHTNAVIFAFAGNAIFAGCYYSMQRLLKARLPNDLLSRFHFWGWQVIIVAAAITLPLGITTSKEYAELEWPIDIAIAIVWVSYGVNMLWHIAVRRERHLYVAIWFYLATWIAIAMLHIVNSLAVPYSSLHSYPVYAGIQDALVQWWYGHNAVAFFLTTPFLGLMYYFLPKAAGRPVYSYRLSIVHFWSLIFIYIWAGPHHLLNSAMPEWAQTLGVVFSIVLLAPSWGGMINGLLTLRGAWDRVRTDPVLKFFVAAVTFYGMATFEGSLLSLREVNALSHNTDWTVGHVHSGALGWVGLMVFGVVYWVVPRLWRTPLWSTALANTHFWMATIGIGVYAISMWIAGIMEGVMQLSFDDHARLAYRDWMEIVKATIPFYWIRLWGGATYFVGIGLCLYNIWRTARSSMGVIDEAASAAPMVPDSEYMPKIEAALARSTMRERGTALHRLIERWPTVMVVLASIAVVIGGACEIIPSLIQGALTPRIASVEPYTPLELTGRDIYIREGCVGCHTQLIRTLRAETERYGGEYTRPGEGIYDRPFLWGSKRTGPDLAREGVLRPSIAWQWLHLGNPRAVAPGSIMPSYPWLLSDDTDLTSLPDKMRALAGMPIFTPYSNEAIAHALRDAEIQAKAIADELRKEQRVDIEGVERKEAIALIAYLRRLGTDLGKPASSGASPRKETN
jgi:cytochrome c oxidase cbb3-type subunit I/II